jgi:hypothetical protein
MTRDEMKAKLALVIEDAVYRLHYRDAMMPSTIANAAAAAVLDLPLTTDQLLSDPRVKALVEAAGALADRVLCFRGEAMHLTPDGD